MKVGISAFQCFFLAFVNIIWIAVGYQMVFNDIC